MLHHRDGARFLKDVTIAIQAKEFNLGFIRPENIVFKVPFGKVQAGCHVPFTEEWLPSGHKGLIGGMLQRWLSFWKVLPSPQRNSRALSELPSVTSQTKGLLPRLLSLAGWPDLGKVFQNLPFMMEATVFLGTFNAAEMFLYPSQDLCIDTILSRSSTDNSFDLMSWFLL